MAWTAPRTWVTSEVVSAAIMNTHVRDNLLETAPAKATAASQLFVATAAGAIASRSFSQDFENVAETTASTSYGSLATVGPQIALTTGSNALIFMSARMSNDTAGAECYMDFAISGASSRSALDHTGICITSNAANDIYRVGTTHLVTSGLTAGSNTFTAQYRVSAGTGTFDERRMIVLPL